MQTFSALNLYNDQSTYMYVIDQVSSIYVYTHTYVCHKLTFFIFLYFQVGTQESSAKLTVNEPTLTFLKKLPEFTRIPLGSNVELIVELSRPDVNVKWLRDKKSITQTTRFTTIVENTVRKLIIKNVTHEDEFEYTCIAEDIQTSTKLIAEGNTFSDLSLLNISCFL